MILDDYLTSPGSQRLIVERRREETAWLLWRCRPLDQHGRPIKHKYGALAFIAWLQIPHGVTARITANGAGVNIGRPHHWHGPFTWTS